MKVLFMSAAACFICLTGCQSTPDSGESSESATDRAVRQTEEGFSDAALSPLEDLNLKRATIPPLLKEIKNPYHISPDLSCDEIGEQVSALNAVLGRDWDIPPPDKKKLQERAADGASTALLDAISSGASGFIPYRGFVRQLSGASSHQKKVLKAYERGSHRRTFLKGIGLLKGCDSPAAPIPPEEEDDRIEFR